MKPFFVALVVGLIAAALPVGTVSAADPQAAVAAPAATRHDSPRPCRQRRFVALPVLQRLLVVLDAGQSLAVLHERTMGKPRHAAYRPASPSTRTNTTWFRSRTMVHTLTDIPTPIRTMGVESPSASAATAGVGTGVMAVAAGITANVGGEQLAVGVGGNSQERPRTSA